MPYSNLEKQRAAQNASAKRRRKKINETVSRKRAILRTYIESKKGFPCEDCGGRFPTKVMDFHHIAGNKLFKISEAANARMKIEAIDAEIAKCILLCANCHRLKH